VFPTERSDGTEIAVEDALAFCNMFGATLAGPNLEFPQAFDDGLHLCK